MLPVRGIAGPSGIAQEAVGRDCRHQEERHSVHTVDQTHQGGQDGICVLSTLQCQTTRQIHLRKGGPPVHCRMGPKWNRRSRSGSGGHDGQKAAHHEPCLDDSGIRSDAVQAIARRRLCVIGIQSHVFTTGMDDLHGLAGCSTVCTSLGQEGRSTTPE